MSVNLSDCPRCGEVGCSQFGACPQAIRDCEHCEHFHDWPPTCPDCEWDGIGNSPACPEYGYEVGEHGELHIYGDPGDGLGVQGACCDCDAVRYAKYQERA
jgi:hypothetical protein